MKRADALRQLAKLPTSRQRQRNAAYGKLRNITGPDLIAAHRRGASVAAIARVFGTFATAVYFTAGRWALAYCTCYRRRKRE